MSIGDAKLIPSVAGSKLGTPISGRATAFSISLVVERLDKK